MNCCCNSMHLFWYFQVMPIFQYCNAEASWTSFVTSTNFTNLRMTTEMDTYFIPRYFRKNVGEITARIDCSVSCSTNEACHAFNFYETESYFVCERQPDNFCQNQLSKVVIPGNGVSLWDKSSDKSGISCLDRMLGNSDVSTCEILRPGCLGTWPDCFNCTRTCMECQSRCKYTGYRNCTLWPEGDAPDSVPIFGECSDIAVLLVKRTFSEKQMVLARDYRMPFKDVNHIFQQDKYSLLDFTYFGQYGKKYTTQYKISAIDADGTLRNLSLHSGLDIFYLKGSTGDVVLFITVSDDIYNCGSFWLIDIKNATYCPGGSTTLFGKPVVDGGTFLNGCMHFSRDYYPSIVYVDGQVSLVP